MRSLQESSVKFGSSYFKQDIRVKETSEKNCKNEQRLKIAPEGEILRSQYVKYYQRERRGGT